jgi:hypothetical protein
MIIRSPGILVVDQVPKAVLGTSLAAWYDSTRADTLWADVAGTTRATTVVGKWDDLSGNARHITNAGTTDRPSIGTGGVVFDGVNDQLTKSFTLPQPVDILCVWKMASGLGFNASPFCGPGGPDTGLFQHNTAPTKVSMYAGVLFIPTVAATFGVMTQQRGLFNGASSKLRNNRGTTDTGNCGAQTIGGVQLGLNSGVFVPCTFYELIVSNTAFTAAQQTALEQYLLSKWGV